MKDRLPILRMEYETEEWLPWPLVLPVVEELNSSWRVFLKTSGAADSNVDLSFLRLARGSFVVDVVAVSTGIVELIDKRVLIAQFFSHLSDVFYYLVRGYTDTIPVVSEEDRRALNTIAGPVARGYANQVNVSVNGNNNHFTIVSEDVAREPKSLNRKILIDHKGDETDLLPIVGVAVRDGRGWAVAPSLDEAGQVIPLDFRHYRDGPALQEGTIYRFLGFMLPGRIWCLSVRDVATIQ